MNACVYAILLTHFADSNNKWKTLYDKITRKKAENYKPLNSDTAEPPSVL